MSLEQALNRAEYRHLEAIAELASRHFVRSGRVAYYHRFLRAIDRMNVVFLKCGFR